MRDEMRDFGAGRGLCPAACLVWGLFCPRESCCGGEGAGFLCSPPLPVFPPFRVWV